MPLLRCRGLRCQFGGIKALDNVDLNLEDGEFVGVIGPNAAGKTTLINAICGLVPIQAGAIELAGEPLAGRPFELRARAGVCRSFEDDGLWAQLSVLDNVAMGATGDLRTARARAREWLERVGLSALAERRGAQLSYGQRRRAQLARLLLQVERRADGVVLLDEPLRGLDQGAKGQMLELMTLYLKGRRAVLMVEHDRAATASICDRLVWMEAGRLSAASDAQAETPRASRSANSLPDQSMTSGLVVAIEWAGYGAVTALEDVRFSLPWGTALQLIGANGSGKSTLLKVLTGGLRPRGQVRLGGAQISVGAETPRLGIGYVPQGGRTIGALTVAQHIRLARNSAASEPSLAERAFLDVCPEVRALRGPAADLSSGQRSMLAMRLALASEPRMLLVDEVGASLAPDLSARLHRWLATEWLNERRILMVVEHEDVGLPYRLVLDGARIVR